MKSIFFKSPLLYDIGIRFLYLDGLRILKKLVGKGKSVFEPACGYGRVKNYLYPCCTYSGIDLNEKFVKYGQKRNRDIQLGNILEKEHFRSADVVLLCDILHHLKLKDIYRLVSHAVHHAREKVVIVEPTFVAIGAKKNFISRFIGRIMAMMDADGFNQIDCWFSREEYDRLFDSLRESNGIKEMKITQFRNHDFVEMII